MVTLRHESVTAVVSLSTTRSMTGGRGKVAGSGVRWKMMLGFLGSSTCTIMCEVMCDYWLYPPTVM